MRIIACLAWLALAIGCSKENTVEVPQTCSTGQYNCQGNLLQVCNASHNGWDDLQVCAPNTCLQGQKSCGAGCECTDEEICKSAQGEGCTACVITKCCKVYEDCLGDPDCKACLDACMDGGTATCLGASCSTIAGKYWTPLSSCVMLHCKLSGC